MTSTVRPNRTRPNSREAERQQPFRRQGLLMFTSRQALAVAAAVALVALHPSQVLAQSIEPASQPDEPTAASAPATSPGQPLPETSPPPPQTAPSPEITPTPSKAPSEASPSIPPEAATPPSNATLPPSSAAPTPAPTTPAPTDPPPVPVRPPPAPRSVVAAKILASSQEGTSLAGEKLAVNFLYQRCCKSAGSCSLWKAINKRSKGNVVDTNLCQWPSNNCDKEGKIVHLNMAHMMLTCSFTEIGLVWASFDRMNSLNLNSNQMEGDMADIVYSLHSSKLSQLRLGGNRITGSLSGGSEAALCNMSKGSLFLLDLRHNQLGDTIPACLFNNGSRMLQLNLGNNLLTGSIPNTFSSKSALQGLELRQNRLTGVLPDTLSEAPIVHMDLSDNQLSGSLPANWRFPKLVTVSLSRNNIQGTLGEQLTRAPQLYNLQAASNNFTALGGAFLTGGLPPRLTFLDVSDNLLRGSIPAALVHHPRLQALYAKENFFSGELPGGTYSQPPFPAVRRLDLSNNSLTGILPDALRYSGPFRTVPSSKGRQIGHVLDLSRNHFSGQIPGYFNFSRVSVQLRPHVRLAYNDFACPLRATVAYIPGLACGQTNVAAVGNNKFIGVNDPSSGGKSSGSKTSVIAGAAVGALLGIMLMAAVMAGCLAFRGRRRGHQQWRLGNGATADGEKGEGVERTGSTTNVQMAGLIDSNSSHQKDALPVSTTNGSIGQDQKRPIAQQIFEAPRNVFQKLRASSKPSGFQDAEGNPFARSSSLSSDDSLTDPEANLNAEGANGGTDKQRTRAT